jgi:hypothetical protein
MRKGMTRRISAAATIIMGTAVVVATPAVAGADPSYVGLAVGYQASGVPNGVSFVSSTAEGAQQGAMQNCRAKLVACAPVGASTQCMGIATGNGTHWDSAEGPDKNSAEANARAKLVELVAGLPVPDTSGVDPVTTGACPWD